MFNLLLLLFLLLPHTVGILHDLIKNAGYTIETRGSCSKRAIDFVNGNDQNCGSRINTVITGSNVTPTPKITDLIQLPVFGEIVSWVG